MKATIWGVMGLILCGVAAAQETDFRGWEDRPGLHFYLVQPAEVWAAGVLSVESTPVRDHVRGEHALRLTFSATKGAGGIVVYRPPGFAVSSRADYGALTFWVKGDGSEGVGVIGIGEGRDTDPRAEFVLRDKTWQPVRLRWSDFSRPVTETRIDSIFFGVTSETKRPASYVIDRIELARSSLASVDDDEVRAAGAKAAKLQDTARPTELSTFTANADKLADLRGRLKEKKAVRVLVVGDAVAQGAGLWNVPDGVRSNRLFWGVLDAELHQRGVESTVGLVAVEGAADAASRMQVALWRFKPDLVVLELSAPPVAGIPLGVEARARDAVREIFGICRRANVTVAALAVPTLPGPLRRVDEAGVLLIEAARAGVCAVDFGKFASARGTGFDGEYYATTDQLNVQGHLLAGKLLTSVLVAP